MPPKSVSSTVPASPTKRFFIEMLTRDIELQDAILDLLDNCVDGIQRSHRGNLSVDQPYDGFWAQITFDDKKFEIADNCGGIPLSLAKKYAFMMGRPRDDDDSDIPTVGMYGIGMKRALFKMGQSSKVTSQTDTEAFQVEIKPTWLTNDSDWNLPLNLIASPFKETGTVIRIEHLRDGVSKILTDDGSSSFHKTLLDLIGQHFGFIIKKGFKVFVNQKEVICRQFTLLWSPEDTPEKNRIAPFIYKARLNEVDIGLAIGFYTPMIGSDELDEEQVTRRSKEDAGWTIICNDRVVVYNDKTRLTGWGEAGVPNYHSQFIGISGVVYFKSNDAWKLPVTTTKRGIDTSSEVYMYIKDFMREGLKKFTNYTNTWKFDSETEKKISSGARSIPVEALLSIAPDRNWTRVHNRADEQKLNLPLAMPLDQDPKKQIRFTRRLSEIATVSKYFFEESSASSAEVGEACFNHFYEKASKTK
ncbi:ATP-binding protein [Collimonas silvisoli]|uniref:ATP-binding protein n=1 Tax=Collimonas silvisoli TaxID=2825884 RepID=UPI001B8CA5B6|nr:ATP-binding protein [Collimonas silvisoli]